MNVISMCWQAGITQKFEAVGMSSADGEFVEFSHSVYLEGPVEVSNMHLENQALIPNHFFVMPEGKFCVQEQLKYYLLTRIVLLHITCFYAR